MSAKNTRAESDSRDPIVVEAQRYRNQRDKNYREQALKIYAWICAHCGPRIQRQEASRADGPSQGP